MALQPRANLKHGTIERLALAHEHAFAASPLMEDERVFVDENRTEKQRHETDSTPWGNDMTQEALSRPTRSTLRQRVLAELHTMGARLNAVPEPRAVGAAVIVTDNNGHRFRVLEAEGKLAVEEDTNPSASTPTWRRVESAQATLRGVLGAMLDVMKG